MAVRTDANEILDAAAACIARFGLGKTTLDDVAKAAGCSRATVYRLFPGKQQLLGAYVTREATALGEHLVRVAAGATELGEAAALVISEGTRYLTEHRALAFVATHEPELILPYLAFERESVLLHAAADLVAPAFAAFLPVERANRLAEWIARMTLSYLFCPSEHLDITDVAQVRALVDEFVLPSVSLATLGRSQ
jgi:AcrR family transcriptional regulator